MPSSSQCLRLWRYSSLKNNKDCSAWNNLDSESCEKSLSLLFIWQIMQKLCQRCQTQFPLRFADVLYFGGSRRQLSLDLILSVTTLRSSSSMITSFTCCFPSAIHHLFTVAVSDNFISKCWKKNITLRKVFILSRNDLGLEKQDKVKCEVKLHL